MAETPPEVSPPTLGDALVVRTRLIPPRLRPQLILRPRLDQLLARLIDYPLTLLKADAGYGKTTAIASYLARSGLPYFWYSIGDGDVDPLVFLLHLIHAFRPAYPTVGDRALALLGEEGGAVRLWAPAVDALANDLLDTLATETVLVLDDYCMVNHQPEVNAIAERLIESMPPCLHLVITSRSMPSLPGRARWRASGELLELGRADLAFTADEIVALFAHRSGKSLTPTAAQTLAAETEGWPIAIHLLSEGLEGAQARGLDELLRRMPGPSELLFNYLAEEVFFRQPREVQTFLTETSILRWLDPAVCNALRDRTDADEILRYLETHSLFVTREGAYRYHHLFRDFLLRRLDAGSGDRRHALHAKAATYYRAHGDDEEAVYHLLAAGNHAAAAELLATIAQPMAHSGRHQALAAWLDQLPAGLLEAHPNLLLARGHAYRFASSYAEALAAYALAGQRFATLGDRAGEVRALSGQALVYLDTVQPAQADPLLRTALRKVGRSSKDERARLLALLAENKTNAGQLRQAERLHHAVYCAAGHDDLPPMNPRIYVRDGRFALARQMVESALRSDPLGAGQWRAPRSHREASVLLAWIGAMTGEAERARHYAGQSLDLGRMLGSPIVECVSLARLGHGWLCGPDFDPAHATCFYEESRLIAERIGVPRFKVEALLGFTLVAGLEGRMLDAEANAREALAILAKAGDSYLTGVLLIALGAAATMCGHPDAGRWLQEATHLGRACGDRFGPCVADLWLAIHLAQAGRPNEAAAAFARALAGAQTHGYDFLFTRVPLLGPKDPRLTRDLLARPGSNGANGSSATRAHRHLHPAISAAQPVALAPATPASVPLYIQTLGPFRVWCGGHEIQRTAWSREKAVHLLQFLVCHRGRTVHREQIMEALWPESASSSAAIGLRVALSTLRKTLTPVLPEASPPAEADKELTADTEFIRREGECLQLDLGSGIRVDADEWSRLIGAARAFEGTDPEQAIILYESALAMYHGDFLEEIPYADWASEEREQRLVEYLSAAERLASLLVGQGESERGLRWANAILAKDPLWEEAYVLLMQCHWQQGHRALAVRVYDRCRRRLREALGVEPSPRTTALFEEISRA